RSTRTTRLASGSASQIELASLAIAVGSPPCELPATTAEPLPSSKTPAVEPRADDALDPPVPGSTPRIALAATAANARPAATNRARAGGAGGEPPRPDPPRPSRGRRRDRASERRILLENASFQCAQLGARLEPELLREPAPERLIGGKRIRLPTAAIKAEHQ